MVNIECQSSSFLFDDQSPYLRKMNSTTNLYDSLTNNISLKMFLSNIDDDEDDDDLLIATSPTVMTSSDSSDSAIVSDEIDDFDINNDKQSIFHSSWPKSIEQADLTSTFASLSQSFNILNQLEQQTIHQNTTQDNQQKYKRPLPWFNSTFSSTPHHPSSLSSSSNLEITSKKVFKLFLSI